MRTNSLKIFILLLGILCGGLAIAAAYSTPAYRPRPAFAREGFTGTAAAAEKYESAANVGAMAGANTGPVQKSGPAPVKKVAGQSYTLLEDSLRSTAQNKPHYGENALSCHAKDWWRAHEKTGNYRQETNNYRQDYPDSCSSGRGEFVLSFYEREGRYA